MLENYFIFAVRDVEKIRSYVNNLPAGATEIIDDGLK